MLSEKAINIMRSDMCIAIDSIYNELNKSDFSSVRDDFCVLINKLVDILDIGDINIRLNRIKEIRKDLIEYDDSELDMFIDSISHAFLTFCMGGLCDLWKNQENCGWYPKIILDRIICPNKIDELDEEIIIYRGCSKTEFEDKLFGQSWTIDVETAQNFAYKTYESRLWFDIENRCILQAKIKREYVYYADGSVNEFEIVVRNDKLTDVKIFIKNK